ncbi:MAG: dihydrofolate reductase [Planctomycetaceae bacterium]|nr:dihydrofolate reductase [Planctomycetaceae bacterium]
MPKVVLFIATSLDGYIARSDGTVDWLFHDADYGYTEFMGALDAVVMGRTTWEQAKTFEEVPFVRKQVFVFSRTLPASSDKRVHHVHGEVGSVVAAIRQNLQQDIWLVGGGDLIRQFISRRLIDEFRLFVHPIILGEGIPLFLCHSERTNLKFEGIQSFPSGLVELRYRLGQGGSTA